MATYFEPSAAGSGFQSIQYGTIAINTGGALAVTATIAAVDITRSHVKWLGTTTDDANNSRPTTSMARLELTNATTVTATRAADGGNSIVVSFAVITYLSLKSNQSGKITIPNLSASATATITAVDITRADLNWLGMEVSDNAAGKNEYATLVLTNSTTITATRIGTASALVVGWALPEFTNP